MAPRGRPRKPAAPGAAERPSQVNVIARALDILDQFDQNAGPLSLMAIVHRTGLHKATAFRLLTTLVQDDLLRQTPTGEYELGYFATRRAETYLRACPLWIAMRPAMEALRAQLNETVVLSLREGDDTIDLDMAMASTPVLQTPPIGRRMALHLSAAGQAILAAEEAPWRQTYRRRAGLDAPGRARAPEPVEASSLAAAILDAGSRPIGALWLSIPPGRAFDRPVYAAALARACLLPGGLSESGLFSA